MKSPKKLVMWRAEGVAGENAKMAGGNKDQQETQFWKEIMENWKTYIFTKTWLLKNHPFKFGRAKKGRCLIFDLKIIGVTGVEIKSTKKGREFYKIHAKREMQIKERLSAPFPPLLHPCEAQIPRPLPVLLGLALLCRVRGSSKLSSGPAKTL